ncbi:MAG: permease [Acidobacteria bacterium]|nr:MAG: permease [Acidobacteriota bacterium]
MLSPVPLPLQIATGFLIALTIGLTGVGGGTITVPVLVLFMGVAAAPAVGTALAFSALVKVPAALVYLRQGKIDFGVLRWTLLGGVPGVVAGGFLLGALEEAGLRNVVLVVVGVTIAVTAVFNLLRLRREPDARPPQRDRRRVLPWLTLPIGLEVGLSSAGAGALGTLVLLYFTPLTAAQVVGTDLAFGFVLSVVGGGLHLGLGHTDPALFFRLVAGGIPGAIVGARLATVLPTRTLRIALLVWLVFLGTQLLYRGVDALSAAPVHPW